MILKINPLVNVNNNKKFYYDYQIKRKKKNTKNFTEVYEWMKNNIRCS